MLRPRARRRVSVCVSLCLSSCLMETAPMSPASTLIQIDPSHVRTSHLRTRSRSRPYARTHPTLILGGLYVTALHSCSESAAAIPFGT
ncbi:hypothetical protein C8Q72DRAFT_804297 [Fomitopsis betulina]|nr:hypothetical protein C8Q72DRAFT_804297 [Fomitopsis betulina]